MKSYTVASMLTDHGFANINIGRTNNYDGTSMTYNMGIVYPCYYTTGTTYYCATNNDNNDFFIDYPINNNILTLSFISAAAGGPLMANMPHYIFILDLVGIKDDDLSK